jgi:CO dehydrogenase maturation factor
VQFHLRNAKAWANDRTGEDLAGQIDPEFDMSDWKEVLCR